LPTSIKLLITIIVCTFFIDQFSWHYDTHWEVTGQALNDPVYLGLTIMWLCIVIWICHEIVKRKKHIPGTLLIVAVIVSAFMLIEYIVNENSIGVIVSFQFLEVGFWGMSYFIAKYQVKDKWFFE